MKKALLLSTVGLVLIGCSDGGGATDAPVQDAADTTTEVETLSYIEPTVSDANLDSDVAPYVLARGAGPARLSPDGGTIVTRLSLTGTRQVYVMDASAGDPKSTLNQLTDGSGVSFFDFTPDGQIIYGADRNGDERENYWVIAPNEAGDGWDEPRLLLPATEQGFRSYGGVSADGTTLVFSSTERNGLDYDIYTADMSTGETRLVFEGVYGNYVQAVSPDGMTAIVSESVGEDSDRLFALNLESGERTLLSDPDPRANHTDPGVEFIDPQTILVATNRDREFAALTAMDIQTGEPTLLFQTDADVDGLKRCGEQTLFTVNRDGFSEASLMAADRTVTPITGLPTGVYSIDCTADQALIRVTASNIPGDLYSVDLDTLDTRRVFSSDFGGLDAESLILPESVRIDARDGVELQGLLYMPEGAENPPVVFIVHGGPTAQSRPTYNSTVQYLLSRDIAVFQPNVRGSTGFGRTYSTLDDQRKRLDSVRDLVDMLDWLEEDGRVDTSRAAVMGGSYGGYMVNAVLADYPEAFDAGIALFGVGDWVTALEVASPALKASDLIEYGDITKPEWREFYTEISPIAKADNIRVPVLYSHGVMDPRIDIAETEVMVRALRENGVRADFVRLPDEGHGWRKLDNRLFYERIQADFLEEVFQE